MTDKPTPLQLLQRLDRDSLAQHTDRTYENARIRYMLSQLGLGRVSRDFERFVVERCGEEDAFFTFPLFEEFFGPLPLLLHIDRLKDGPPLHERDDCAHPLWWKRFFKLPFVSRYLEWRESVGAQRRPTGLIFPLKGFPQGLVVHDGSLEKFLDKRQAAHVYDADAVRLLVQPLTDVVAAFRRINPLVRN